MIMPSDTGLKPEPNNHENTFHNIHFENSFYMTFCVTAFKFESYHKLETLNKYLIV